MTQYTFDATAEGWDTADMAWNGVDGSPSAGCMRKTSGTPFKTAETQLGSLSIPVTAGAPLSFRVRIKGTVDQTVTGAAFVAQGGGLLGSALSGNIIITGGDTGWMTVSGTLDSDGTVDTLIMRVGSVDDEPAGITFAAFDTASIDEAPTGLTHSAGGIPGSVLL